MDNFNSMQSFPTDNTLSMEVSNGNMWNDYMTLPQATPSFSDSPVLSEDIPLDDLEAALELESRPIVPTNSFDQTLNFLLASSRPDSIALPTMQLPALLNFGTVRSGPSSPITMLASDDVPSSSCDESERSSGYSSSEVDEIETIGLATKRYRQPISMRGMNLTIGPWNLKDSFQSEEWFSFEIKFLFGRRKVKYEISSRTKTKSTVIVEYTFSHICGLEIKPELKLITIELSEPPIFYSKDKGKSAKIPDFTNGNAMLYPRHRIDILSGNFDEILERVSQSDRRMRELLRKGITHPESQFPESVIERATNALPVTVNYKCEWDNDNVAVIHCKECSQNFCSVCDDVLHRNSNKKGHVRQPIEMSSPKVPKKNKKRKKSDRCRCGTGATKGTLGEPCTGNRCPCFSNGRGCDNCGCKNCSNPLKAKTAPNIGNFTGRPIPVTNSVSFGLPIPTSALHMSYVPHQSHSGPRLIHHVRSVSM